MTITGRERRYLRALAHRLDPVVLVGQRGLTDAVLRQVDAALTDHELIKVKLSGECPADRDTAAAEFGARTGCELAGAVGRVLILYRPHPDQPRIQLPRGRDTETGARREGGRAATGPCSDGHR